MKKRISIIIVLIIAVVILAVAGWFKARDAAYDRGSKDGYLTGYSIGYTDGLHGIQQQSQTLAGQLAKAGFGSNEWKGFMMGFPEGYDDGREAGLAQDGESPEN